MFSSSHRSITRIKSLISRAKKQKPLENRIEKSRASSSSSSPSNEYSAVKKCTEDYEKIPNEIFENAFMKKKDRIEKMVAVIVNASALAREVDLMRGDDFEDLSVFEKTDRTVVTVADFAIQKLVEQEFGVKNDVLGEEDSRAMEERVLEEVERLVERYSLGGECDDCDDDGDDYFVLDPIDGTNAFARRPIETDEFVKSNRETKPMRLFMENHRNIEKASLDEFTEQYCIGLSLHNGTDGRAIASVLAAPRWKRGEGVVLLAVKGCGCFQKALFPSKKEGEREEKISSEWTRCSVISHVCPVRVAVSESEYAQTTTLSAGWTSKKSSLDSIAFGSGSLIKYIGICTNDVDCFVHYKPWANDMFVHDHASGILCAEESGARVTDGKGKRITRDKPVKGLPVGVTYANVTGDDRYFDADDIRRTFSPGGRAIIVANEESLHAEVLKSHKLGVEEINAF